MWSDEDEELYAHEVRQNQYWEPKGELTAPRPCQLKSSGIHQDVVPPGISFDSKTAEHFEPAIHRAIGVERKARGRSRNTTQQEEDVAYCTLFVGNVPLTTCNDELEELFEPYGKIHSTYVQQGVYKPGSKFTFGFVRFFRKHEAEKALKVLNKKMFKGRHLNVEACKNPKDKEEIDNHRRKRAQQKSQPEQLAKDDEEKLWQLVEKYTYLLEQSASDGTTLQGLGEFLNSINNHENSLVPSYKDTEYKVDINLHELQHSFVERLSAECDASQTEENCDELDDFEQHNKDILTEISPYTESYSSNNKNCEASDTLPPTARQKYDGASAPSVVLSENGITFGRGRKWLSS